MWHRIGLVGADVSEERVSSIFRVEKQRAKNSSSLFFVCGFFYPEDGSNTFLTRPTRRHIPEDGILHCLAKIIIIIKLIIMQLSLVPRHIFRLDNKYSPQYTVL
jgi:hypothetical protein